MVHISTTDKILIQFTPTFCTIGTRLSYELNTQLYDELAFQSEGYFFAPAFQSGNWDGYIRLYQPKRQRFRSGLLYRVVLLLSENGYTVEVEGKPEPITPQFDFSNYSFQLRAYQQRAAADILAHRFGIVQAPMRSGKTIIFISVVHEMREFPTIFFCRSLDLAYQTQSRVREFLPDIDVGIVGDGKVELSDQVTIMTIQSAFSAYGQRITDKALSKEKPLQRSQKDAVIDYIRNAKVVFYDEAHHTQSKTSRFILDKCLKATMKIGLTATPGTGGEEDLRIEETIGPVIHRVYYSELIKEGFILRPVIYMYSLPDVFLPNGTNYASVYRQAVVENTFLTRLVSKISTTLMASGRSVVVQADLIKHIRILHEAIPGSVMLTGKDTTEYRQEVFQKLKSKEVLCVVSTLFEEGIDIPSLDFTINVAGGLSNISTLQRMRSITAHDGKKTCGIVDFYHSSKYLKRHSERRLNLYREEPEFKIVYRDVRNKTVEDYA